MKTEKELAQQALDVQNACNLSGVVFSLGAVVDQLWEIDRAAGCASTARINRNPIVRAFVAKLADLSAITYETEPGFWSALEDMAKSE